MPTRALRGREKFTPKRKAKVEEMLQQHVSAQSGRNFTTLVWSVLVQQDSMHQTRCMKSEGSDTPLGARLSFAVARSQMDSGSFRQAAYSECASKSQAVG